MTRDKHIHKPFYNTLIIIKNINPIEVVTFFLTHLQTTYTYAKAALSPITHAFLAKIAHHELTEEGFYSKYVYDSLNFVFKFIAQKLNPLDIITKEVEEAFNKLKQSSNNSLLLSTALEKETASCAAKTNIDPTEASVLVDCAQKMIETEGDTVKKGEEFAACAGIDIFDLVDKLNEMKSLSLCMTNDIKTAAQQAKVAASSLRSEMADLSSAISHFKDASQFTGLSPDSSIFQKCASNVGGDASVAAQKLGCFANMLNINTGIAQQLQFFIKCDKLTIENASDEIHNVLALAQCVNHNMEYEQQFAGVNVDGSTALFK